MAMFLFEVCISVSMGNCNAMNENFPCVTYAVILASAPEHLIQCLF